MKRLRGMTFPLWATYWLLGLGVAWAVAGWVFSGVFWLIGSLVGLAWGVYMGRKYARVTLEPLSKERGTVVWWYRRKDAPRVSPRLVWEDVPAPLTAPDETPVKAAAPSSPSADEATSGRPLPFPRPGESLPVRAPAPAPVPVDTGTKNCPDCAESVLSAARVCRYCGYRFEPALVDTPDDAD